MQRFKSRVNVGFTLSDVALVLIILAILVAIIFPALHRPKYVPTPERACLSNERQLGLAISQYTEDYDDKFPCGTAANDRPSRPVGWAGQIYMYIKSSQLYHCPADGTRNDPYHPSWFPVSYAYNWNVGQITVVHPSSVKAEVETHSATLADLTKPDRTVLFCETTGVVVDLTDYPGESSSPAVLGNKVVGTGFVDGNSGSLMYATGIMLSDPNFAVHIGRAPGDTAMSDGVHHGGSNFLLADGHVKWLSPSSVSTGLTNQISSTDCTAGQGLNPKGRAPNGYAAGTGCIDPSLKATFSIN